MAESADRSDIALRYDAIMGRWSRIMASRFVAWLSPEPGGRWLDVGCGTGALTAAILEQAQPSLVFGVDPQHEYVERARCTFTDARCHFLVGEAQSLPVGLDGLDHTVSGLMLNLLPDASAAFAQMRRVTRPGGSIAAYLWDFADGMQFARHFWDVARQFDPQADVLDQGRVYPLCHPDRLRDLFAGSRLRAVRVDALEVATIFRDFQDYWVPLETGVGRISDYISSLAPERRECLRERLRAVLPTDSHGSLPLRARAWAVIGHCPE